MLSRSFLQHGVLVPIECLPRNYDLPPVVQMGDNVVVVVGLFGPRAGMTGTDRLHAIAGNAIRAVRCSDDFVSQCAGKPLRAKWARLEMLASVSHCFWAPQDSAPGTIQLTDIVSKKLASVLTGISCVAIATPLQPCGSFGQTASAMRPLFHHHADAAGVFIACRYAA